jgi:putative peptidoglycan lipid II flippase
MVKNFLENGKLILWRRQSNILSAAFVIMVTVFASRILGLFRDRLLAGAFFGGREWQLDTYFAAFRIPDMIFQLLVLGALSAAFIPVFSEYLTKNEKEAYQVSSSVINLVFIFFLAVGVLVFLFANALCHLIAPSFSAEQINLMVDLTRIMLLAQLFFCFSNFLTGIIQSHQRFLVPALSPVVYNLGIIFGIVFLAPIWGIYGPTIGVVLGAVLHLLVQLPLALKLGFVYQFSAWDFTHPGVKEIARLMLPRTLALAVSQIESTVAVFLATSLAAGSLSIFYFAQHLMNVPVGLFGATIGQAALPSLSRETAMKETNDFKKTLTSSLFQILFLVLPASAILLILRVPVVRLAFGAKNFPWQATLLTGKTLGFFILAIICQSLVQIFIRGFYALHDTKTPLIVGALSVFANVCLSIYLTFNLGWGVIGLAIAASLASVLQLLLLFFLLDRKIGGFPKKVIALRAAKMALATFFTLLFLWVLMRFLDRFILDTTRTVNLIILTIVASLIGLLVYVGFAYFLRIEELAEYFSLMKRLGKWRQVLEESEEVIEVPSQNQTLP